MRKCSAADESTARMTTGGASCIPIASSASLRFQASSMSAMRLRSTEPIPLPTLLPQPDLYTATRRAVRPRVILVASGNREAAPSWRGRGRGRPWGRPPHTRTGAVRRRRSRVHGSPGHEPCQRWWPSSSLAVAGAGTAGTGSRSTGRRPGCSPRDDNRGTARSAAAKARARSTDGRPGRGPGSARRRDVPPRRRWSSRRFDGRGALRTRLGGRRPARARRLARRCRARGSTSWSSPRRTAPSSRRPPRSSRTRRPSWCTSPGRWAPTPCFRTRVGVRSTPWCRCRLPRSGRAGCSTMPGSRWRGATTLRRTTSPPSWPGWAVASFRVDRRGPRRLPRGGMHRLEPPRGVARSGRARGGAARRAVRGVPGPRTRVAGGRGRARPRGRADRAGRPRRLGHRGGSPRRTRAGRTTRVRRDGRRGLATGRPLGRGLAAGLARRRDRRGASVLDEGSPR